MKKLFFALTGSMLVFALSCSKDSEDDLNPDPNPPGGCDTVNMQYTADVLPILTANCFGCHGASSSSGSGGIVLEGYTNIKARADNGDLIGVITHASGYPAMPQGGSKLSDCDINKIRSWINNGKQDN